MKTETDAIREYAKQLLGVDAKPTCEMRMLSTKKSGRLQQLWSSSSGRSVWLDVPNVEVNDLPKRLA